MPKAAQVGAGRLTTRIARAQTEIAQLKTLVQRVDDEVRELSGVLTKLVSDYAELRRDLLNVCTASGQVNANFQMWMQVMEARVCNLEIHSGLTGTL